MGNELYESNHGRSTLNVTGLPPSIIVALEALVASIRLEQVRPVRRNSPPVRLPSWPGTVIGSLDREEIYRDVV